jgi:hypothetical protein
MDASMERLRKAAEVVRDKARFICKVYVGKLHGPYTAGKYAGKVWTARDTDNLLRTIRVVESKTRTSEFNSNTGAVIKFRNVWVMAGNYKTWYAQQVEFGRGGWKGGAHPFLRKALYSSREKMISILRGDEEGGTEDSEK